MSWKFWKKKDEPPPPPDKEWAPPTDLYDMSKLSGVMYARSVAPFGGWQNLSIDVPAHSVDIFRNVFNLFEVWTWFILVKNRYGTQASRIALDVFSLQASRETGVSDASQLVKSIAHIEDVASRASAAAQTAENRTNGIPWTRLAAIDLLTLLGESSYYSGAPGTFGGNEVLLGQCIAKAIGNINGGFDDLLRPVVFRPDKFVEWVWRARPGGYERHLQRRFDNPLFTRDRRIVTALDVYLARVSDDAALEKLRNKVNAFVNAQPEDLPLDAARWCNETRETIDKFLDECYRVGGDMQEIVSTLRRERNRAIVVWKALLGNDAEKLESLERAEEEMTKWEWLRNEFVQQSSVRDYVPIEELASALLSEPVENIRAYCKNLLVINKDRDDPIPILRNVALSLVRDASVEMLGTGREVPDWKRKVDAISNP